jgi:hypothetical protein
MFKHQKKGQLHVQLAQMLLKYDENQEKVATYSITSDNDFLKLILEGTRFL